MLRGRKDFGDPPFVVWRVFPASDDDSYRLVPHAILRHLRTQAFVQFVGLVPVSVSVVWGKSADLQHLLIYLGLAWIVSFAFFVSVIGTNALMIAWLNAGSAAPVCALMRRCPDGALNRFNLSFPVTNSTGRVAQAFSISVQTDFSGRFRGLMPWQRIPDGQAWSVWLRRIPLIRTLALNKQKLQENRARLRALRMRQEDSFLHAISAFAVVTSFVAPHRHLSAAGSAQIRFLGSYFSPVIFGFCICALIFTFGAIAEIDKRLLMICITLWFVQSIYYVFKTLGRDFATLFANYFDARPFPRAMTRYAREQMSRAPDLARLAEEKWLSAAVTTAIFGLATLYVSLLQNLD